MVIRDCITDEEERKGSKAFQLPYLASHNDQPQLSSTFSWVAQTQGLPPQVIYVVNNNFIDGNGGSSEVSRLTIVTFNGHDEKEVM